MPELNRLQLAAKHLSETFGKTNPLTECLASQPEIISRKWHDFERQYAEIKENADINTCSAVCEFTVKVVEEQKEIIQQRIAAVCGGNYTEITLDRQKVFEAIGKAVKRKPFYWQYGANPEMGNWQCPNNHIIKAGVPYCEECGQALDWSGESL